MEIIYPEIKLNAKEMQKLEDALNIVGQILEIKYPAFEPIISRADEIYGSLEQFIADLKDSDSQFESE